MYFLGADVLHMVWASMAAEMMPQYDREPGRFEKQISRLWCHEVFDALEVAKLFGAAEGREYEQLARYRESAARIRALQDSGYFIAPGSSEVN